MLLVYCYSKCSTCKKALAYLNEKNIPYALRDLKTEHPGYEEIKALYEKSGLPLKRFFNTSGLQYKALGLKDRLSDMPEEEQLQLLASDGMLVKRPLLIGDAFVLPGFKEAEWEAHL